MLKEGTLELPIWINNKGVTAGLDPAPMAPLQQKIFRKSGVGRASSWMPGSRRHSASTRLRSLRELRRACGPPKRVSAKAEDARDRAGGRAPE